MSRCDGMGDMEVLEASAARRAGSTPVIGTSRRTPQLLEMAFIIKSMCCRYLLICSTEENN